MKGKKRTASKPDANGIIHKSNPRWAQVACILGGAIIGSSAVNLFTSWLLGLLGVVIGAAIFTAGLYPTTQTAYWRTVERHHRKLRKARQ